MGQVHYQQAEYRDGEWFLSYGDGGVCFGHNAEAGGSTLAQAIRGVARTHPDQAQPMADAMAEHAFSRLVATGRLDDPEVQSCITDLAVAHCEGLADPDADSYQQLIRFYDDNLRWSDADR